MTLVELQKLVAESKGEWEHLEFKKTTGELHGGMETLCAFLNGLGSKVLFGVANGGSMGMKEHTNKTEKIEWTGVPGRVCSLGGTKENDHANDTGG
jgi:predicted HTH transcriptional regulator